MKWHYISKYLAGWDLRRAVYLNGKDKAEHGIIPVLAWDSAFLVTFTLPARQSSNLLWDQFSIRKTAETIKTNL